MSTAMIWQIISTGSDDTERLGELMAKHLEGGEVIELRSDLGGGKTTFTRGLVRGLMSKDIVTSPTFTLSNTYKGENGLEIHHYDFYRLSEPGIMAEQLAESRDSDKTVTVVEWSDIVKNVLPAERITVEFKPTRTDPDERAIAITYPEDKRRLIIQVETEWKEVRP